MTSVNTTKKMVAAALLAALVCAATILIRIPIPATGGYIHPGDALVILSGALLGPFYGFFAAGIGSCLADLLGGYLIYAPVSFVLKGVSALICGVLTRALLRKSSSRVMPAVLGGCANLVIVCIGYFLYETILYGAATAVISLIPNAFQGAGGLVIAVILYPLLSSVPMIRELGAAPQQPKKQK